MARPASPNPRRTVAALCLNETEKSVVASAFDRVRESIPDFAATSMNSFVRAAVLDYAARILSTPGTCSPDPSTSI
jgi:hypothetical protein